MRIQHNIMAMNSYRNFNTNTSALSKNLEKLSSGYRINRAGDDAAGLAISEKMRAQITGLDAAQKNVKDGISLVKTAEGAMQEVQDMLNRMKYLATQSANGTYQNEVDRENLQKEVEALTTEIDRIADSANFNGQTLLDGKLGGGEVAISTTSNNCTLKAGVSFDKSLVQSVRGDLEEGTYTLAVGNLQNGQWTASTAGTTVQVQFAPADGSGAVEVSYVDMSNFVAAAPDGTFKSDVGATNTINLGKFSVDLVQKAAGGTAKAVLNGLNGLKVVAKGDGSAGDGLKLQIGDTAETYNQMEVKIDDMHAAALKVGNIDISTQAGATSAIETITDAINKVSQTRGDLGAIQNRLEHTANNLSVMEENIQDAESTIRDTDMADEMTAYTKNNILVQAAQAMLAQANQQPQGVLQLLQ